MTRKRIIIWRRSQSSKATSKFSRYSMLLSIRS